MEIFNPSKIYTRELDKRLYLDIDSKMFRFIVMFKEGDPITCNPHLSEDIRSDFSRFIICFFKSSLFDKSNPPIAFFIQKLGESRGSKKIKFVDYGIYTPEY